MCIYSINSYSNPPWLRPWRRPPVPVRPRHGAGAVRLHGTGRRGLHRGFAQGRQNHRLAVRCVAATLGGSKELILIGF